MFSKIQAVRLVLALDFGDQHLAQLRDRRRCRDDSTIRFDCRETTSAPACRRPWPLECGKPWMGERDIRNVLRIPFSTTVTGCAGTPSSSKRYQPLRSTPPTFRLVRIEDDGEKIGQHAEADALGEGLAFGLVLLAVAFDAVAENLVEEDAGGAAGEDGRVRRTDRPPALCSRPVRSLATRSMAARMTVVLAADPWASTASKVSDVVRSMPSSARATAETMTRAKPRPCCEARAFGGGQVLGFRLRQDGDAAGEDARIAARRRRKACGRARPTRRRRSWSLGGASEKTAGATPGEVVRLVLFLHLDLRSWCGS